MAGEQGPFTVINCQMTFPALENVSYFSSVRYKNQLYINYILKASVGGKVLRKRFSCLQKSRNTLTTGRLAVHFLVFIFKQEEKTFFIVALFENKFPEGYLLWILVK